jgi:hypothetical protein
VIYEILEDHDAAGLTSDVANGGQCRAVHCGQSATVDMEAGNCFEEVWLAD